MCLVLGGVFFFLASLKAAALFPQSAVLDLSPRLQASLLATRIKVSVSPDPLIHGQTPADLAQTTAVDSTLLVFGFCDKFYKCELDDNSQVRDEKSCRFSTTFV